MASFPNTNFPLSASDRADVIRIYLELLQAWDDAGRAAQVTTRRGRKSLKNSHAAGDEGELADQE